MDIKEKARKISVLRASRLVLALDSSRPPCTIFEPSADGFEKIKRHLRLIFNELQITYLNVTRMVTFLYFRL
jgi:hypothetical protein